MEREAEARIDVIEIRDRIDELRQHISRDTELAVTGGRQRIELAALFSNQDVRARDIRAAGEVETNKRNLAGTEHIDAARTTQRDEVTRQCRKGRMWIGEQTKNAAAENRRRARHETL